MNSTIRVHVAGDFAPAFVPLRFGKANAKLAELKRELTEQGYPVSPKVRASLESLATLVVATFSLPAGWTCPAAIDCLAKADRVTGRITDGAAMEFRCFAATDEARSPGARDMRWHNFNALRSLDVDTMAELIDASLHVDKNARKANVIRIHVSGDFFSQRYFDAWIRVASMPQNQSTTFYAYVKSLNYWVARLGTIPANLNLTASKGGRHDALIDQYGLKFSQVVFSEAEAEALGLVIDHDDSHAAFGSESFALLLHGTQPKGSKASAAISAMRANGTKFSYAKN